MKTCNADILTIIIILFKHYLSCPTTLPILRPVVSDGLVCGTLFPLFGFQYPTINIHISWESPLKKNGGMIWLFPIVTKQLENHLLILTTSPIFMSVIHTQIQIPMSYRLHEDMQTCSWGVTLGIWNVSFCQPFIHFCLFYPSILIPFAYFMVTYVSLLKRYDTFSMMPFELLFVWVMGINILAWDLLMHYLKIYR